MRACVIRCLKDETSPVQAKYKIAEQRDLTSELTALRDAVQKLPATGDKLSVTPKVGHEFFKIGTLTDKVPQFHSVGGRQSAS